MIHPTAIISPHAELGSDVEIGPYSVIEDGVRLGDRCKLHSHVVIHGQSRIGTENEFFPFSAIGIKSQDLKYTGEPTRLEIGDRNVFRENSTVHRGTLEDTLTKIGSDNLFLAYSHVAHDCTVGNHVILSNNGTLAGHVVAEDYAILSGLSAVHQFCRLGQHSIVGGCAKIVQDVPPFTIVDGNPASVRGINQVGLHRRGFADEDIRALRTAYKKLFLKKELNLTEAILGLPVELSGQTNVAQLLNFIDNSDRGIIR
ncbi:acyl-ACP--UDP-N-acetylglucosamine O-acyltransferase [Akkermansiaceae bacterium]|nr:acyl-ACP--UDP-N-acetylglucosamine O-acyltransferase [Akkermansiaceae bacterium]MDB4537993.1 acyl-ACP--UDP-N-acetylglucosamine O-acyltransferase [Akkermansiaceae bacterium]